MPLSWGHAMSRSFFNGGLLPQVQPAADPPATQFGWQDNLLELPALTFDAGLSSGISEAQLLAGLSLSSGALVINMADMITAGASVGAFGAAWLTEQNINLPSQLYTDGAGSPANTGSATNNSFAGLALYHFATAEAASPSNPAGGTEALASMEWGLGGSGSRQHNRQSWGAAFASAANVDFVGGTVDVCRFTNGRTGIVRQGGTYPPVASTSAVTDSRAITNTPIVDAARLRLALIVRLTGSATLTTISIRQCRLDYRPA